MILPLHTHLRDRITAALQDRYALDPSAMPPIVIEYPPTRRLGDLAVTVAFELARTLRKAPRAIAQEIAETVGELRGVGRGPGSEEGLQLMVRGHCERLVSVLRHHQIHP